MATFNFDNEPIDVQQYKKGRNTFMDNCLKKMVNIKEIELNMVNKLNREQVKSAIIKTLNKLKKEQKKK